MASAPHSPEPQNVSSPSTAATTPEGVTRDDNDSDDIWESDSNPDEHYGHPPGVTSTSGPAEQQEHRQRRAAPPLSDLPTVKRQHMTDGYREGLAVGKARVMQRGFDAGYPTGMAIAVRVGRVLGVLEGCLAAKGGDMEKRGWQRTLDLAGRELACASLLTGLTDEVVDRVESGCVPDEIEVVVARWERLVFGMAGPAV